MIIFKATQTSTLVNNILNSVRELGTSYNDSGKCKCLYLQGRNSECKRIDNSLPNEMVVMGICSSGTRVEYRVFQALSIRGSASLANLTHLIQLFGTG